MSMRHDKIDVFTLRHGAKLHHVGVEKAHRGSRVLVLACDLDVRVLSEEGELLPHFMLDPDRNPMPLGAGRG